MKNLSIFLVIAVICVSAAAWWRAANPPPPADYEIVYFGSSSCGVCRVWKREQLPAWREEEAARFARLHMAELYAGGPGAWQGGFGRHDDVFHRAFGEEDQVVWPSFVLLNHGEVEFVGEGLRGWEQVTNKVRAEASWALRRGRTRL